MNLRAWVELLRLPALFTVPGDALAGAAATGLRPGRGTFLAIGSSLCLYEAGMALNDWADRAEDAVDRPQRPIPSGRVTPTAALTAAVALTAGGLALAARAGRPALATATALAGTVWAYDLGLKRTPAGPAAMAAARGLDLLLGAVATRTATSAPTPPGKHTPPADPPAKGLAVTNSTERAGGGPSPRLTQPGPWPSRPSPWPPRTSSWLPRTVPWPPRTALGGTGAQGTGTGGTGARGTGAGGTVPSVTGARGTGPGGTVPSVTGARGTGPGGTGAPRTGGPYTLTPHTGGNHSPADTTAAPLLQAAVAAVRAALPAAATLAAHTLAVTTVSRNETQGGSTGAPLGALVTTLALGRAMASSTPSAPEGRHPLATTALPGATTALAAAYAGTAARPYFHATLNPSPPLTQRAVGGGIRALIPLQAALAARYGSLGTALLTAALAPAARRFARKVSVT
ncbi:UbiA family prenyltransferase [Streptomyces sp. NPDC017940]|uniref:UbiA family prenyltransferase n=1 Tax=Streptomyces sp. NPDC017940 TaxID=3365017 RepID=UPI003796B517